MFFQYFCCGRGDSGKCIRDEAWIERGGMRWAMNAMKGDERNCGR
jgi:hypothetical protein